MIDLDSSHERDSIMTDFVPDLTPLIDVMFMLIVFLVLTTNSVPHTFDIALPKDKADVVSASDNNEQITVTLFAEDNKIALNGKVYQDFLSFSDKLQALHQETGKDVIIYGDKATSLASLMQLLTFMRGQSIPSADIVMEK